VTGEGACANTVVVSETSVRATDPDRVPQLLEQMDLTLVPLPVSAAVPAARAFAAYLDRLKAEGKTIDRKAPLPDFLVGTHGQAEGLALVTRDPARVSTYFPKVRLVTP
jgi:predicted nucleic acid-binding protein